MKNVRYKSAGLWLWVCLFALAPVQVVHAQADRITGAELGRIWVPPVPAPGSGTMVRNYPSGASVAANASTLADTGGGLAVSKSAKLPLPDGRVVDMVARSPITKAAMGKALGGAVALFGGPLGVGLFGMAAIIDYLNSSGLRESPTSPGILEISDPNICTKVGGCSTYSFCPSSCGHPYVLNVETAAASWASYTVANPANFPQYSVYQLGSCPQVGGAACRFNYYYRSTGLPTGGYYNQSPAISSTPQSAPVWIPATQSQIEAAAATPTMKPEWLQPLLDAGVAVDAGNASITGPASVTSPSKTTTQQTKDAAGNVTGTTTINTSTVTNISYAGNTYVTNNVSTITTTNPDGTTKVDTQTEATPETSKTDCEKFPDSIGCSTLGTAPVADPYKKSTSAVSVVAVNFTSASACPAPLSFTAMTHTYSISYQPLCDRLALLRTLFLMVAGVIAAYILANSFKV